MKMKHVKELHEDVREWGPKVSYYEYYGSVYISNIYYYIIYIYIYSVMSVYVIYESRLSALNKLRGFSPLANYTDRATAACRRSSCQSCGSWVSHGQHKGSRRPYSRFSRSSPLLFLANSSSNCTHEAEWTPFQTPLLLRKSGSAGNLSRTSGSAARNSDH
jgi:hypothetical protein